MVKFQIHLVAILFIISNVWSFSTHNNEQVVKAAVQRQNGDSTIKIQQNITKVEYETLKVPEGMKVEQIGEWLEQKQIGTKSDFLNLINDMSFYQTLSDKYKVLPNKVPSQVRYLLEGYLLGGELKIPKEDLNQKTIIEEMVKNMDSFVLEINKDTHFNLSTHEVIIIASIVEKEAFVTDERKNIAGVFYNRITQDMKLQSCVTAMYAVNKNTAPTKSDIKYSSPYNTYTQKGLPIGPINNPSKDSLLASFKPKENNYLFFVGDGKKTYFSSNYEEHLRKIKELL